MTKCIIDKEELASLLKDSYILSALEAGGVDNWEWYSESLREDVPEEDCSDDYYSRIADESAEGYEVYIENVKETNND